MNAMGAVVVPQPGYARHTKKRITAAVDKFPYNPTPNPIPLPSFSICENGEEGGLVKSKINFALKIIYKDLLKYIPK